MMTRLFYTLEKIPIFFDIKIFHPNKTQVYNRFLYSLNAFFDPCSQKIESRMITFQKSTLKKTLLIITISTWAGLGDARWSLALGRDFFPHGLALGMHGGT